MTSVVNVATWDDDRRRLGSFTALAVSLGLALAALAVWWFTPPPAWVWWIGVGLIGLVLVFMAALLLLAPKAATAEHAAHAPSAEAMAPAPEAMAPDAPAPAVEPRVLTLRCGDCGTIFDVTDTGERPLYHTCPGCGAEGALRDPVEPAPAMEEAPAPAPEPPMEAPAVAAAPAPAAPAVKRLKLRCGGCKEVFTIDDTGERPLKRPCPHCGRMGMIR